MATLSVLAALGVDILPLIAGASVVGVAIGFGSQTLVRDVVSGAFFLMDDAFRFGEYIEVGDAKGRVEKINVRSLFLRHHRGAINILPYGEIRRLRNTNRDWMIMVMDFRLTYDTNLPTVKKIMKQVGEEIAADPELTPDLLQPLKMGGVQATEDSAIVVRAKFTARPEGEPYMIRKAAYTKILKAFREAGIKFAHKQVTVNVPASQERRGNGGRGRCGRARRGGSGRGAEGYARRPTPAHPRAQGHPDIAGIESRCHLTVYSIDGVTPVVDPSPTSIRARSSSATSSSGRAATSARPRACAAISAGSTCAPARNVQDSCMLHAYPGVGTHRHGGRHVGHRRDPARLHHQAQCARRHERGRQRQRRHRRSRRSSLRSPSSRPG